MAGPHPSSPQHLTSGEKVGNETKNRGNEAVKLFIFFNYYYLTQIHMCVVKPWIVFKCASVLLHCVMDVMDYLL